MNDQNGVPINSSIEGKFIVTPRIESEIRHFNQLCKSFSGSPIMVVGPTGAGKTLYLKNYEMMYRQECKSKNKTPNVFWANCAHFGGINSDPNIARSELFGHVKGATQNALKDSIGLLHRANGGLLILEEVGELPPEVQAMLLTFIETGKFRKVGGTVEEKAKMKIISATNREDVLREDFKFRFFPFYVSGLHERRYDILYYLYAKYPEVFISLTGMETLVLLAHNWPGNCRELDRVANLMLMQVDNPIRSLRLDMFDKRVSKISKSSINELLDRIEKFGADLDFLTELLGCHGLNIEPKKEIFAKLPTDPMDSPGYYEEFFEEVEDLPLYYKCIFDTINAFDDAYSGFADFCTLFGQNVSSNSNILQDILSGKADFQNFGFAVPDDDYDRLQSLQRAIMMAMKEIHYNGDKYPDSPIEFWNELEKIKTNSPGQSVSKLTIENEYIGREDFENLNETQLLKKYYEGLLKRCGGNVRLTSQKAGLNERTLRSKLDRIGVDFKKRRREIDAN